MASAADFSKCIGFGVQPDAYQLYQRSRGVQCLLIKAALSNLMYGWGTAAHDFQDHASGGGDRFEYMQPGIELFVADFGITIEPVV
ncbi:hypothetical protein C7443_105274 [Plasticicumulans acidivorans]|uniref:Uncharacterized protein n=1 Tax=Plasticicumulans acidivorans TaxID=886464 RepID=A0A317N0H7_9GAMM|nr:hypothetical protein C7443_105274 [Plasticicumulans acidivorans]